MSQRRADFIFYFSLISFSILQLLTIYYSPLALSPDETHYWEWSRRLDFCYYSKGPLVAFNIAWGTTLFGDTALGVRFPAFIYCNLFSVVFYFFTRKLFLPLHALLGFFAIRTMLIFVQTGILMTTDASSGLLALLGICACYLAVVEEKKIYWIIFGFAAGMGSLAKYTILFLFPSVVLLLLFTPRLRKHFLYWQFILGFLLFIFFLTPTLVWNAQHDWVNFAHNAGHILKKKEVHLTLSYFFELILGQLALVSPVIFCAICYSFYRGIALWKKGDLKAGVFLFCSFPLFVFILLVSFSKRVYANWPLPVYVGGMLLLIYLIYQRVFNEKKVKRLLPWAFTFSLLITILSHFPFLGISFGLPGRILPTKKLVGWKELAAKVEAALPPGRENYFLLADDYEVTSELAFYVQPRTEAYCANLDSRRMNQYDIWGGWENLKERNAIIVLKEEAKIEQLRGDFESITEIPQGNPALSVIYNGDLIREFYIYQGKNYSGRVFDLPVKR